MTVITIHMCKNDGLEKKKKKFFFFFFFFVFLHPGGSVLLPGVRESGCISGRLPDDPGGFTCMLYSYASEHVCACLCVCAHVCVRRDCPDAVNQ